MNQVYNMPQDGRFSAAEVSYDKPVHGQATDREGLIRRALEVYRQTPDVARITGIVWNNQRYELVRVCKDGKLITLHNFGPD